MLFIMVITHQVVRVEVPQLQLALSRRAVFRCGEYTRLWTIIMTRIRIIIVNNISPSCPC